MYTNRSFDRKFGRKDSWKGRGNTPLWPWKACFWSLLCLMAAIVLTVALLLLSGLWKVSSVTVVGNIQYPAEELVEASGITVGDRMGDFDRKGVAEKLMAEYPLVRSVKVSRRLNGKVILKVTEETDLYYTCHRENYYLVSAKDLTVLGIASYGEEYRGYGAIYLGFPEEARLTVGEKVRFEYLPYEPVSQPEEMATFEIETQEPQEEYSYVWEFVDKMMTSPMKGRITGVDTSDKYDLYLVFDGHIKIRFGNMKNLDDKIDLAVTILKEKIDGSTMPALLDVSNIKEGSFRANPDIKLPEWAG